MNSVSSRSTNTTAIFLLLSFVAPAFAQDTKAHEGADLVFGGPGAEPGKFSELRDITFDAQGNLWSLEGAKYDAKTGARTGNHRVQQFSNEGKLLTTFDLSDDAIGEKLGVKNDPQRIAVAAKGEIYITFPAAGRVQRFARDGKFLGALPYEAAMAIAVVGQKDDERIALICSREQIVKGKRSWIGGGEIILLQPSGMAGRVKLQIDKPLEKVQDLAADRDGNFYVQAEPNAVYKFSPEGKLLRTLGGNPTSRSEDGSEILHTVAVDSKGNVFTYTWGNPGLVTRFSADGQTVTQRGGQFKFADPWSVHSHFTVLAISPDDRLWVAATHTQNPKGPNFDRYRAVPAIIRTNVDFFEKPAGSVKQSPTRLLGFKPEMTSDLTYNVAYELERKVTMTYRVAPANRVARSADVTWRVVDAGKHETAQGKFHLDLINGQEAKTTFSFELPRFGAYMVLAQAQSPDGALVSLGEHLAVTPAWPNMPVLKAGEARGDWEDAPRQMWCGLPNQRLDPIKGFDKLDKLDESLKLAEKYGTTVLVQLVDSQKNFNREHVRIFMERFKGRVKFVEVCNEPNFSGSADDYFKIHKQAYDIIKAIDPKVQVMGPATVNLDLNWLRRLYELGFKEISDIVSLHDYEGHESITPEHWIWKLGEVRMIMERHGDAQKPIWQTERAITGVRGFNFMGLVQAIRTTLHRDLLETLHIPSEHNNHYYLNQGGYSSVPSYVWSKNGPHPAALALRTRHALTAALGRSFAEKLDFGPNGNALFLGVRYGSASGETFSLRNLGTRDTEVTFQFDGPIGDVLETIDAWGNHTKTKVANGQVTLTLGQLPLYVDLPGRTLGLKKGTRLTPIRLDWGANLAPKATFSYSSTFKGELAWLNNGVIETYHNSNPNGDTNGKQIWQGEFPEDAAAQPPTLEITFEKPQRVNNVVLRGVRPDNAFCSLLAYDLQYQDGMEWKTVAQVDQRRPTSEEARTADAAYATWMDDTNFHWNRFEPITTSKLRLVVRATSRGFLADDRAKAWGNIMPQKLMLREVEIYGPP
jgi:hypothetical protein